MIGQAGVLNVLVTASTGQANAALMKTSAQFRGTAATAETTAAASAVAWRRVGLGLIGVAVAAGKLSMDFGKQMRLIETQAGAPAGEIAKLQDQVLDLSKHSKFAAVDLAEALFHVESVGFRGQKAMKVLNSAQKLATVGQSDLEDTTYALVSALETGIKGTEDMTSAIGLMNSIVGHGDMRMEDFTAALSTGVLPSAKNFGLSLRDVGAAMDVMTARGTPAQAAATRLRMTFSLLGAQTDKAKDIMNDLGIEQGQLGETMQHRGLIPAVQMLADHLKNAGDKAEQAQALTSAFGGGRSSSAIMTLVQNMDDLKQRYHDIGEGQKGFNEAWKQSSDTAGQRFAESLHIVEAELIVVGRELTGPASQAVLTFAKGFAGVVSIFKALPSEIQAVIGGLIGLRITAALMGPVIGRILGSSMVTAMLATEMGVSAQVFAMRFMEKTGGAIPLAIAAVGIGNIVMKGINGDMKGATMSTLGATAGAAIGAAIGGGLPGALVGMGIGSIAGNFLEDAFGSEKVKKGIHRGLKAAMAGQAKAFKSLGASGDKLKEARKKEQETAKKAADAERHYQNVLASHGKNSMPAIRAEHQLKRATQGHTRAVQAERRAEREHGLARKLATRETAQALNEAKREIKFNKQRADSLRQNISQQHRAGVSFKDLQPKIDKWSRANHQAKKAQDSWNTAMKKSVDELGPKTTKQLAQQSRKIGNVKAGVDHFAKALKHMNENAGDYDVQARMMNKANSRLGHTWSNAFAAVDDGSQTIRSAARDLFNASQRQKKGTEGATGSMKKYGGMARDVTPDVRKLGDVTTYVSDKTIMLKDKAGPALIVAKNSVKDWSKVSIGSTKAYEKALNSAIEGMGLAPVHWKGSGLPSPSSGGKGGGRNKQQGGFMRVPGMGSGDKVPLHLGGELRAMVEPNEFIGVVNRDGAQQVNAINGMFPRMRSGGVLGVHHTYPHLSGDTDFLPALGTRLSQFAGATVGNISVTSGWRSTAEQAALYASKGPGLAAPPGQSHHEDGTAADIAPAPHGQESKYGLTYPMSWEPWHIELVGGGGAKGVVTAKLPHIGLVKISGPPGVLTDLANAGSKKMQGAANQYIQKHAPMGGLLGMDVATGPIQKMAQSMVKNIWGGGQWGPFNALEVSEANWDPTAENASSGAAGLAQALPASKYPPGAWPYHGLDSAKLQLAWMMQYIKGRYGNPAGAWAFHQANNWYKEGGAFHVGKGIGKTLRHLPHMDNKRKRRHKLDNLLDHFKNIGLPKKDVGKIAGMDKDYQVYADLAERASAITGDNPVPVKVSGPGGMMDQAGWLGKELHTLWDLRTGLVRAQDRVGEIRKHLDKQQHKAKKRLRELKRDARQTKKHIDKLRKGRQLTHHDIKEMKVKDGNLNKRIRVLENKKKLSKQEREELKELKKNERRLASLIEDKKLPLGDKRDKLLKHLGHEQHAEQIRIGALSGDKGIIGALKTQSGKVKDTLSNFTSLDDIQGIGSTRKLGTRLLSPVDFRFGGELLNVQLQLRDLASPQGAGADTGLDVGGLQEFAKLVRAGAFSTQPFMGAFGKGGVALVGERGPELAHMPSGTRIHNAGDTQAMLTPHVDVNVTLYEDTDRYLVDVNGQQFEGAVKRVNKKTADRESRRGRAREKMGVRLPR